jgi:hypothetical protein
MDCFASPDKLVAILGAAFLLAENSSEDDSVAVVDIARRSATFAVESVFVYQRGITQTLLE